MAIRKAASSAQFIHPNIDRAPAGYSYIGTLADHFCADIVEDFLKHWGVSDLAQRWSNGHFLGWTHYWLERRLALRISLNRDYRGQPYFLFVAGFALLPEDADAQGFATGYLLREATSLIAPVSLVVELVDLVALRFACHTTLLTPAHVEYRVPWMIETARTYQASLTRPSAHRAGVLISLPDSYFAPAE